MADHLRVPRVIHFPFGYSIRVKQVTKRELRENVGEDCVAGWMCAERTIYLTRTRPIRQKRADLAHELGHAVVDYHDFLLTFGLSKI